MIRNMDETYTQAYFDKFQQASRTSAAVIVPLVMQWVSPQSVIDLGCGMAEWLAAFQSAGVTDIVGVDGAYATHDSLVIAANHFVTHDFSQPYRNDRRFDLAMSVEVAEHLPADAAPAFVASLT